MSTEEERNADNPAEESERPTRHFASTLDEQRGSTRFQRDAGTDFAAIWREPGEEFLAEVHDESLTGLGLVVDAELELQVGDDVHVVYAGEYLEGDVRHVRVRPDGRCFVGLRCQRMLPEAEE